MPSLLLARAAARVMAAFAFPATMGICGAVFLAASAVTPTESRVQQPGPGHGATAGASLLGLPPGFSPVDRPSLAAMAAWLEFAARPTATATATAAPTNTPLPASTPVPPTPAPRLAGLPQDAAPSSPPAPPPPPSPPAAPGLDTSSMDAFSYALFEATNARRASVGLPPLRVNPLLVGIARIRSNEMAQYDYFAHTSPVTGHTAFSLMDLYGVPFAWAGENLALNNYPDDQTVAVADQALWDSPSHHENIVNPHYTDVGIALAVDAQGKKYFTIVFVGM